MFGTLMDKTVTVRREVKTQDASGATVRGSFVNVATGVQAAIQAASSRLTEDYARRNIRVTEVVYSEFDFDTNLSGGIKLGDQIVDANSVVYVVRGFGKDSNSIISPNPLYKIACERLIS